jgi:hypothetical protein
MARDLSDRNGEAQGADYRSGNRQPHFAAGGSASKLNSNANREKSFAHKLCACQI